MEVGFKGVKLCRRIFVMGLIKVQASLYKACVLRFEVRFHLSC